MKKLVVIKGPKGTAVEHALALAGNAGTSDSAVASGTILASGQGNLPSWVKRNTLAFWSAADETERRNGTAFREYQLGLPEELSIPENVALVKEFLRQEVGAKPYQFVIQTGKGGTPSGSVRACVMISDRVVDGIERGPNQFFRRFRTDAPSMGGARKDGQGKLRGEVANPEITRRRNWTNMCELAQSEEVSNGCQDGSKAVF